MDDVLRAATEHGWQVDPCSVPGLTYLERLGEGPFTEQLTVYSSKTGRPTRAWYCINYRAQLVKGAGLKAELIRMLGRPIVRSAA